MDQFTLVPSNSNWVLAIREEGNDGGKVAARRNNVFSMVLQHAAQCARKATVISGLDARVAGCVPPLQQSYIQRKPLSPEAVMEEYTDIVESLAPLVDVILCETMSGIDEATAAVRAARTTGLPLWVSFSLEDSLDKRLRSKEPLVDAVHKVQECAEIEAILLNCCAPEAISAALPALIDSIKGNAKVGCYPNAFQMTTTEWLDKETNPEFTSPDNFDAEGILFPERFNQFAHEWVELGAQIIGGCCGTTPSHISVLSASLRGQSELSY